MLLLLVYFPAASILQKSLGPASAKTSNCVRPWSGKHCVSAKSFSGGLYLVLLLTLLSNHILSAFVLCLPVPLLPPVCLLCPLFSSYAFLLFFVFFSLHTSFILTQHVLQISCTGHPNLLHENQDTATHQLKAWGCTRLPYNPLSFMYIYSYSRRTFRSSHMARTLGKVH